jgi:protein tyrosine phosphatase (PTP) superfamily phosphohydrolase (DUF442 family)
MTVTYCFPGCRASRRVAFFALFVNVAFAEVSALPNYREVNSEIARGGQPTPDGFRNLAAMGVRTIVDLRGSGERSESERALVTALGMRYVSIPMSSVRPPTTQEMSRMFEVLNDRSAAPTFVHCRRGADRTGTVLAVYRMEHDRWTNRQALREARRYGMSWYQVPRQRYISSYEPGHSANSGEGGIGGAMDSLKNETSRIIDKTHRRAIELFDRIH